MFPIVCMFMRQLTDFWRRVGGLVESGPPQMLRLKFCTEISRIQHRIG